MALFFFEIHGTIERKKKLPSVLLPSTGFLEAQQEKFGQQSRKKKWEAIQGFGVGCTVLIASAFLVTQSANQLASDFGIKQTIIGITLLSLSTTLPETMVNLSAIRRKRVEIALGNLIGSVVINLGLGGLIIALLHPATLNVTVLRPAIAVLFGLTLLYWVLSKRIQTVSKRQGIALLIAYFLFIAFTFFTK